MASTGVKTHFDQQLDLALIAESRQSAAVSSWVGASRLLAMVPHS